MALPIEVDSLDGLDESLHEHYVEVDGKWRLDGVPNTATLEDTMKKERKRANDLEKKYKDVDPDEYNRLRQEEQDRKNKKLVDQGDVDGLLKTQKEQIEEEYRPIVEERDQLRKDNKSLLVTDKIRTKALEMDAKPAAVDDIISRAGGWELQEGEPVLMQDGQPVLENGTKVTIEGWLKNLQSSAEHLFEESDGAGGRPGGGGGTPTTKTMARAAFDALPDDAARMAFVKDGGRVVD